VGLNTLSGSAALADVPPGACAIRTSRFFMSRNPGHAQGDELVCLTEPHFTESHPGRGGANGLGGTKM